MSNEKRYLGDSVYVTRTDGMVTLTTENGYGASNTVHLEPEVMRELARYIRDTDSQLTADLWRILES